MLDRKPVRRGGIECCALGVGQGCREDGILAGCGSVTAHAVLQMNGNSPHVTTMEAWRNLTMIR